MAWYRGHSQRNAAPLQTLVACLGKSGRECVHVTGSTCTRCASGPRPRRAVAGLGRADAEGRARAARVREDPRGHPRAGGGRDRGREARRGRRDGRRRQGVDGEARGALRDQGHRRGAGRRCRGRRHGRGRGRRPRGRGRGAPRWARAMGLGVDVGVNAGVALLQRPVFERDVREALEATLHEWEERLSPELERVQAVWFDEAAALLSTGGGAVGAPAGG